MKVKKIIAAAILPAMLGLSAFAESNDESRYFDMLTNYAANLYINEEVSSEDLLREAAEAVLKDNPELMYEMIKAAFRSLDDYSEFYTAEEYKEYYQRLNKIFFGMGVVVQRRNNEIVVVRLLEGGGARAAGIQENDVLLEIDSVSVEGMSLEQVTATASGEEGTYVGVKIRRGESEMTFDVERRRVEDSTVNGAVLKSNIGYIEIMSFAEGTADELAAVLESFDEENITDIILDLRNNPGGMLSSVIDVARQIVPEGVITSTIYRNELENETYYSELADKQYKFAVLVNGGTASAAEVLTGALQDSGAGYVIGEPTYGKGVIQNVFNLKTGDAFKITTGHYLTRNGNDINGVGIIPDENVINSRKPIDLTRYEVFDYATKWHVGESGAGVLAAKQRLSVMGYYYGEINEYFDTALEKAVYSFQERVGLYPYGVLDLSTQATLENNFYIIEVTVDDQLDAAYEYLGGKTEEEE